MACILTLPYDVRPQIYGYVIPQGSNRLSFSFSDVTPTWPFTLLLVSKEFREDVESYLLGSSVFDLQHATS